MQYTVPNVIRALLGNTGPQVPPAQPFIKDQGRVPAAPWPTPVPMQGDVRPGMTIPGAAPILPASLMPQI